MRYGVTLAHGPLSARLYSRARELDQTSPPEIFEGSRDLGHKEAVEAVLRVLIAWISSIRWIRTLIFVVSLSVSIYFVHEGAFNQSPVPRPSIAKTVRSGQTTWGIISSACPNDDPRVVISNYHLPSNVQPLQKLRFSC